MNFLPTIEARRVLKKTRRQPEIEIRHRRLKLGELFKLLVFTVETTLIKPQT